MVKKKIAKIKFIVEGIPPYKDFSRSIRNYQHPDHDRFLKLRKTAKVAMKNREYHRGPVAIKFHYIRKEGKRKIWEYLSGILDSLGGSHGFTFHWVPIVFLDDCQIQKIHISQETGKRDRYLLEIIFL